MVLQFRQYFLGVLLAHPRNLSARGGMPAAVLTFKNLLRVINPQREADRVRVMGPSPLGSRSTFNGVAISGSWHGSQRS